MQAYIRILIHQFRCVLCFSYAHRGENGVDVVGVYEGPPGLVLLPCCKQLQTIPEPGYIFRYFCCSSGTAHYVFVIKTISTFGGGNGNFLDDVNVTANSGFPVGPYISPFCPWLRFAKVVGSGTAYLSDRRSTWEHGAPASYQR